MKLSKSESFAKTERASTLCYRGHLNLQGLGNLGGFVVLSFRWLNLQGFIRYAG
ncbi:MAG: hypothetical protein GDA51_08005 [Ekhidna sp.]|nr:hypothetical protein [Ekhidna sp.]